MKTLFVAARSKALADTFMRRNRIYPPTYRYLYDDYDVRSIALNDAVFCIVGDKFGTLEFPQRLHLLVDMLFDGAERGHFALTFKSLEDDYHPYFTHALYSDGVTRWG